MSKDENRERRLAEALRENLRKRKTQAREGDAIEEQKLNPGSGPG